MNNYQTVPFNIAGGIGKSRAKSNNNTNTINLLPEVDKDGSDKFILTSFAGQKHLPTTDDLLSLDLDDRGMTNMNEVLYRVNGTKLLKVTNNLIQTEINNLPITGTKRCIFANNGSKLVIINGDGNVLIYDTETDLITEATDPYLVDENIKSVSYVNSQFIYTSDFNFIVSDVNQPDNIFSLNFGSAESHPDKIVRGYVYNSFFYAFGERTIEMFSNTGRGNPPFERMNGSILSIGLAAKNSLAHTDKALYFLADDQKVYRTFGGQHQEVSSKSIVRQIQKLNKIDDATAFTFSIDGYNFYAITFPESRKTFCLNEEYGSDGWFELNSGDYTDEFFVENTYNVGSFLEIFNKRIMCDLKNGRLFELDPDTYTNDGKPILRERITHTIDSSVLGIKGKKLQAKNIELIMEKGVGNIIGDGEDPKVILDVSYDGGQTWKHISFLKIGRFGETTIKVEAPIHDKFYTLQLRIRVNDPVYIALFSVVIDLRIAGR